MRVTTESPNLAVEASEGLKNAKLLDAANQFESMLLQELLKPMRTGQDSWKYEEESDDRAADTISSFGTEALAKAISKNGGLGVATQVVRQVLVEQKNHSEMKDSGTKDFSRGAD
jgi:flagellar protein FlgJ